MDHFLRTTFFPSTTLAAGVLAASSLAGAPAAHANVLFWDTDTPLYALATGIFGVADPIYTFGPQYYDAPVIEPDYSFVGPDVGEPRFTYTRPNLVPNYSYQNYISAPVYAPTRAVAVSLQPWTPAWYRYCEGRYRSFNATTGTFTGYDGRQHFCRR